jgi:hypothetical protein
LGFESETIKKNSKMIIRVRTSLGTLRVETLGDQLIHLKEAIFQNHHIPIEQLQFAWDLAGEEAITGDDVTLAALGITHGALIYLVPKLESKVIEKPHVNDAGEVEHAGVKVFINSSAQSKDLSNATLEGPTAFKSTGKCTIPVTAANTHQGSKSSTASSLSKTRSSNNTTNDANSNSNNNNCSNGVGYGTGGHYLSCNPEGAAKESPHDIYGDENDEDAPIRVPDAVQRMTLIDEAPFSRQFNISSTSTSSYDNQAPPLYSSSTREQLLAEERRQRPHYYDNDGNDVDRISGTASAGGDCSYGIAGTNSATASSTTAQAGGGNYHSSRTSAAVAPVISAATVVDQEVIEAARAAGVQEYDIILQSQGAQDHLIAQR